MKFFLIFIFCFICFLIIFFLFHFFFSIFFKTKHQYTRVVGILFVWLFFLSYLRVFEYFSNRQNLFLRKLKKKIIVRQPLRSTTKIKLKRMGLVYLSIYRNPWHSPEVLRISVSHLQIINIIALCMLYEMPLKEKFFYKFLLSLLSF